MPVLCHLTRLSFENYRIFQQAEDLLHAWRCRDRLRDQAEPGRSLTVIDLPSLSVARTIDLGVHVSKIEEQTVISALQTAFAGAWQTAQAVQL